MKPLCMCLVYFSKTFKNIESSLWCFVPFLRAAAVDECDCDKLDFAAARAQNKEGLDQFVQDRTVIAALNDRLVRLIELVSTNCNCCLSAGFFCVYLTLFKPAPFRLVVLRTTMSLLNVRSLSWRKS